MRKKWKCLSCSKEFDETNKGGVLGDNFFCDECLPVIVSKFEEE